MRMPRFRFTVRGMMVVVAVVALASGAEAMRTRRARFLALASEHAHDEQLYRLSAEQDDLLAAEHDQKADVQRRFVEDSERYVVLAERDSPGAKADRELYRKLARVNVHAAREFRKLAEVDRHRADYHSDLRRKYDRAARRPWWIAPSAPPEPDWEAMLPDSVKGGIPYLPEDKPSPLDLPSIAHDGPELPGAK